LDLLAPVSHYCERLGPGLFAEPLNAMSNLGFFIAGGWLLQRDPAEAPGYSRRLAALILLIGLASLSFHTFANVGTEILDSLFIAVYVLCFVVCYFHHFLNWPWPRAALLATPGFALFGWLVTAPFPAGALNGSVMYLPALAGVALMAVYTLTRRQAGGLQLALAAAIFSIALFLRSEDRAWCLSLPMGTHWIWHCLNAITLTLVTLSLDRADGKADS
jgi:hypothetical protein